MYKEKFIKLANAVGDDEDALDIVRGAMNALVGYVKAVYDMEIQIPILHLTLKDKAFQDRYTELDQERSRRHDAAIACVGPLNRLAEQMGVEPLFTGNPAVRLDVAAFCISVVDEIFQKRVGAPPNEA